MLLCTLHRFCGTCCTRNSNNSIQHGIGAYSKIQSVWNQISSNVSLQGEGGDPSPYGQIPTISTKTNYLDNSKFKSRLDHIAWKSVSRAERRRLNSLRISIFMNHDPRPCLTAHNNSTNESPEISQGHRSDRSSQEIKWYEQTSQKWEWRTKDLKLII